MPTKKVEKEHIQKIVQDKNIKDNSEEDEKKLMEEWEKYMNDFVPEDINTVILEPRTEIVSPLIFLT